MPFVPDTRTTGFTPDTTQKPKGIFSRIGESLSRRLETSKRMFSTFNAEQSGGFKGLAQAAATGVGIVGQVAGGVGDIIGEAAISAGKEVLDDETEQSIADFVSKVATSKPVQTIAGKWSEFEKTSPYASAALSGTANIVGLTGTGAFGKAAMAPVKSALKSGVGMATKGALRTAETVAPRLTSAVKTGVQVAKDVAESAGSQLTAMSPQTIRNIVSGKVSKQAVESLDRVSIATRAKEGIDSALSDLSGLGKEYDVIRKTGQTVDVPVGMSIETGTGTAKTISKPISDALEKFGLSMDPDGKIVKSIDSKPFDEASMASIQDFVTTYGKTGELTADQFLNVRQAADKIVDWNSKTPDLAEAFSRTIRENYDDIGKTQIKGLADLDTKYAPMRQELGIIKRDFLTPQGQLKDTAFTTLANLTNKGREQVLARLEKYVPGITQDIHVLRAVEDIASAQGIKVGTYTRAAVSGAIALADMKSGILFFAMTHPSVVVPLLRKYGELRRGASKAVNSIIRKMDSGEKLNSVEKKTLSAVLLDDRTGDIDTMTDTA